MSTPPFPRKVLTTGERLAIGLEACRRYLSAGHSVVAHYFGDRASLTDEFPSEPRLKLVQCDLADLNAASELAQTHTNCDIAIFLASLAKPSNLANTDESLLERTLAVSALSNYMLIGALGPAMALRRWGRIVIGSSIGVKFGGGADSFAYALANNASEFLPRSMRDWTRNNVLTNVVRIGVTDTSLHDACPDRDFEQRVELIPSKRAAITADVADFITWYTSEQKTYVAGRTVAISGGE